MIQKHKSESTYSLNSLVSLHLRGGQSYLNKLAPSMMTRTRNITPEHKKLARPCYNQYRSILLLGEADFSFTRAFAQVCNDSDEQVQITATEYGDGNDISLRYHNGDTSALSKSVNSICNLASVKEIISGLNARVLGDQSCICQRWNQHTQEWDPPSKFWRDSSCFDLIIFNFPHSDQAGRAAKLIKALFKQIRICINDERLNPTVVVEMRLRVLEKDPHLKKSIRSYYKHEESAEASHFKLIGCWDGDLNRWEKFGYQHKWTRRNASCRDVGNACKVWRWEPK